MKRFAHLLQVFAVVAILFNSCKKSTSTSPAEKQGSNFNKLLKTISRNVSGTQLSITTHYSYSVTGELSEVTREFTDPSASSSVNKDVYYRKQNGELDSIIFLDVSNPQTPAFQNFYKTEFHYDAGGKIDFALNRSLTSYNDSCVYTYLGSNISQRYLYRKAVGSSSYSLLVTLNYDYDAAGNLVNLSAVWSNPASSKNSTYTYDNKPGSLPVREFENELFGFWIKAFDNTYKGNNNPLSRRISSPEDWEWSNIDYDYQYSANNKVLYQKIMHTGTPDFYEVFYYYD